MIVQCEQCKTKFRLADEKIGPRGAKVRCSKCAHVFVAHKGQGEASTVPPASWDEGGRVESQRPAGFAEDLSVQGPPPAPPPPPKGRESYIGFDASPPRSMPKPPESRLGARGQPPPPPSGSWLPPASPPPGSGELPSFEHPSGITAALSPLSAPPRGKNALGAEFGLDTAPGPKLTLGGPPLGGPPPLPSGLGGALAGPPPLPPAFAPPRPPPPPPLPSKMPSLPPSRLNEFGEPSTERASLPPPPRPSIAPDALTSFPPAPMDASMRAFDSSSLLDALNNTFVGPPGDPFAVPEPGPFTNPGTIESTEPDMGPGYHHSTSVAPGDDIARIELKKGLLGHAGTAPAARLAAHNEVLTRIAPEVVAEVAIETKPEKKSQGSPARTLFLLGVLVVVTIFAVFVSMEDTGGRVGSPLDLLGLARPAVTQGALSQIRTTQAHVTLYPGREGRPLLIVRGQAKNHGPDLSSELEVVALMMDDTKVVAERDAPVGSELTPDVLSTIGGPADLDSALATMTAKAGLKEGETRSFMVVFPDVPKDLERFSFRVEFRSKKKG